MTPTINKLAYDAYLAYAITNEPVTVSFDDFISTPTLLTTWINVANVFVNHYGNQEQQAA